ncbi:MAG TPA: SAP domain-containing protein [Nakamurella sp.]
MTISTDVSSTNGAAQVLEDTEKSVESWKQGVKLFTDQADLVSRLPKFDLTEPVARYFEFVQRAVDLNREWATRWAELFTSLSGSVREQAEKVGSVVTDQVDAVAELATTGARRAEELADQQAAQAEEAAKEHEREIKRAERAAAKKAKEAAREPYEGLTKVELSDQLAERDLPKTGNVDELIERLVSADSE